VGEGNGVFKGVMKIQGDIYRMIKGRMEIASEIKFAGAGADEIENTTEVEDTGQIQGVAAAEECVEGTGPSSS
jgi:hypothetical protein